VKGGWEEQQGKEKKGKDIGNNRDVWRRNSKKKLRARKKRGTRGKRPQECKNSLSEKPLSSLARPDGLRVKEKLPTKNPEQGSGERGRSDKSKGQAQPSSDYMPKQHRVVFLGTGVSCG